MTTFVYKNALEPPAASNWLEWYDSILVRPTKFPTPPVLSWDNDDDDILAYLSKGWERAKAPSGAGWAVSGREVTTERSRPACLAE